MAGRWTAAAVAFLLAPALLAQEPEPDISQLSIEELLELPVSSTALRARSLREAPGTVHVITADTIRERGYLHLYDALREAPGLEITWMGGLYGPIVMPHGLDSAENNKVLLLVDGVVDNNLSAGTAQVYMQYGLQDVARIEIVYGPASALYGANAMAAVVNIVTRTGAEQPGVALQAGGMSWDPEGRRLGALGGATFGKVWGDPGRTVDVALSVHAVSTRGPDLRLGDDARSDRPDQPGDALYYFSPRYTGAAEDGTWLARGRARLKKLGLTVAAQVWEHRGGQGTYAHEGYAMLNGLQDRTDVWNFRQASATATWDRAFAGRWANALSLTWRDTRLLSDSYDLYFTVPGTGPDGPGDPGAAGSRYYRPDHSWKLEDRVTFTASPRASVTFGLALDVQRVSDYMLSRGHSFDQQHMTSEGTAPTLDEDRRYDYRDFSAYAEHAFDVTPRLSLTTGLRVDSFALEGQQTPVLFGTRDHDASGQCLPEAPACVTLAEAEAAGAVEVSGVFYQLGPYDRTRTSVNPRLGAVWQARPDRLTVKALYGEGFRMPTVRELFSVSPSRTSNPGLDAEKVRTGQLSALWRVAGDGVLQVVSFYTAGSNLILPAPGTVKRPERDAFLNQFQNVGAPRAFGVDLVGQLRRGRTVELFGHYSFQRAHYAQVDAGNLSHVPETPAPGDSSDRVPRQATHKALVGASLRLLDGRLVVTPRLRLVGSRPGVITSGLQQVDGYGLLNLSVVLQDLLARGLVVRMTGYNVGNADVLDPGFRTGNKVNDFPAAHPQPGLHVFVDATWRLPF